MSATRRPSAAYLADPEVESLVYRFAEQAGRAESRTSLDSAMAEALAPYGIDTFILCQSLDNRRRPTAARLAGRSMLGWRKHYLDRDFAGRDDLLGWGQTTNEPVTWTSFRGSRPWSRDQNLIYDEARAFGLQDGFYLPIQQPDGSMLAVSLMTTQVLPQSAGTLAVLHMLSVTYAMAAQRLGLDAGLAGEMPDAFKLTPRQIECLEWVTAGKSSVEIGDKLSISEHTVNEHLESARRRLGVSTTTQAVLVAALRGLIMPRLPGWPDRAGPEGLRDRKGPADASS